MLDGGGGLVVIAKYWQHNWSILIQWTWLKTCMKHSPRYWRCILQITFIFNKTNLSSKSVVDRLLQKGTVVLFGKWYGDTSIYRSGSCLIFNTLWFKLTRSLNCPLLFLVGCWLIHATVPCKEVVDSDYWMSTSILSADAVGKTPSLKLNSHFFRWPQLQYYPWILKAATINVLICISLTLITFQWVKDLVSCCESSSQSKQVKVACFMLNDKTTKNLSWFE